jgi:hypothetical protein
MLKRNGPTEVERHMTDVKQMFRVIQGLPVRDRLWLVEQIAHDLVAMNASRAEPNATEQAPSLLGLFADEPDLVDEVCGMAMDARKRDTLRANDRDHESDP